METVNATAPAATLEVVEEGTGLFLSVRGTVLGEPDQQVALLNLGTTEAVKGVQESLREVLDGFKDECSDLDEDDNVQWTALEEAFAQLLTKGRSLVDQLLGVNGAELASILEGLLPGWKDPEGRGRTVEVICDPALLLPIEFLPLLGYDEEPAPASNYLGLYDNASRFLGFSCFVRRHIRSSPVAHPRLNRTGERAILADGPALRVGLFLYSGLEGAPEERTALAKYAPRLKVLGPWPEAGGPRDAAATRAAVAQLAKRIVALQEASDGPLPHLLHFACHCYTTSATNFEIELQAPGDEEVTVSLDHLAAAVQLRDARLRKALVPLEGREPPLVFMNACGSSAIEPRTARSLPGFFVDKGFLGFLGTETAIPDEFASAFSHAFYSDFVDGVPLGRALHRARWRMLERNRNPLGLLYTAYVDAEIYATSEVEEGSSDDG
jgi:hypothetical protein